MVAWANILLKYVLELPMLPTALPAPLMMAVAAAPEFTVIVPGVTKLPVAVVVVAANSREFTAFAVMVAH